MSDSRRIDEIRDEELARISRMVRDSEAGWLFYGPAGQTSPACGSTPSTSR